MAIIGGERLSISSNLIYLNYGTKRLTLLTGGPTGLFAGLLLDRLGVSVCIIGGFKR